MSSAVELRVVKWIHNFLTGRSQRIRMDGHLSQVRVNSGVPQWSVLGPLQFVAYVNDILRNIEANARLFADDCVIYRRIYDSWDVDKLQSDLNKLGECAVENEMKMNLGRSKSVSYTKDRVRERIEYF
jgi:hypothetical protein